MPINLDELRFIPQSSVKSGKATLDKLVYASNKRRRDYDLRYEKELNRFTIAGRLIGAAKDERGKTVFTQDPALGWTAALTGSDSSPVLLLLRTPAETTNLALRAKFLKQPKYQYFVSDYLTLLIKECFEQTPFWQTAQDVVFFRLEPTQVAGLNYDAFEVVPDEY